MNLQIWDQREQELKELEGSLYKLYDDIDENIQVCVIMRWSFNARVLHHYVFSELQSGFISIGDRMTQSRVTAYTTEIARVSTIKTARAEEITRICDEICEIWNEMELSATEGDDIESHIQEEREVLGWGQALINTLASKLAALQTEKVCSPRQTRSIGKKREFSGDFSLCSPSVRRRSVRWASRSRPCGSD
jgi:hypothetical protein